MYNSGDTITSIKQTIDIDWYGEPLFSCGWNNLIVLRNVDGCDQLGNCPQQHGLDETHVYIDTAPFEAVVDLLTTDRLYLRFTIDSYDQKGNHISCTEVKALACKHGTGC